MKVSWTRPTKDDRTAIFDYIEAENPRAAVKLDRLFERAVEQISQFPYTGRVGQIDGTREAVPHPNYRLVYSVADDTVYILGLFHAARQWPPETL